jgi:4-hydroxyphenylpyruvate dioxygenase
VTRPTRIADEHGEMVYSEVVYYNDVRLRWIQGRKTYKGAFIPGYKTEQRPAFTYGLKRIDHIVSNVPCITDITEHLNKMLGFHEFSEFTAEDVGTVDSGLNSMVMANNDETVLLPINEPTFGTRRKSQIQSFLEHHCGSGIQHIAISTDDVIASIEKMVEAGIGGGVEFMPNPGEAYYRDHVPAKMGNMVTEDLIKRCQKYGILIDRDEEGGLLQIFTKPMLDRPTLFVEIIQRLGCKREDGTQKPACGGFGKGNFGALFKSIEDWEKIRDGEA